MDKYSLYPKPMLAIKKVSLMSKNILKKPLNLFLTIIGCLSLIVGLYILTSSKPNSELGTTNYNKVLRMIKEDHINGEIVRLKIDDIRYHSDGSIGWSLEGDKNDNIILIPDHNDKWYQKGDIIYFKVTKYEDISDGSEYNLYGRIQKAEVNN